MKQIPPSFQFSLLEWLNQWWFQYVPFVQRIGMGQNFPWLIDSAICVGVILHGLFGSQPNVSCCISFKLPGRRGHEVGLSFLYLLAGYYSFVSSMALAPYRSLYAMAIIGYICFASRIIERRNMVRGDISSRRSRKHSHRHWHRGSCSFAIVWNRFVHDSGSWFLVNGSKPQKPAWCWG